MCKMQKRNYTRKDQYLINPEKEEQKKRNVLGENKKIGKWYP